MKTGPVSEAWRKEVLKSNKELRDANNAYDKVRQKITSDEEMVYITEDDIKLMKDLERATEKHMRIIRNPY